MKRIAIIFLVMALAVAAGIFYLNEKVLPTKIRAAIVKGLEETTGKKVSLGDVRLDLFKGLVLKDLIIRDDPNAVINVREARCALSGLVLESPDIFIERRQDGSLNILELFPKGPAAKPKESPVRSFLETFVRRIAIKGASVNFHDLTLEPVYSKDMKAPFADINILPEKARFSFRLQIPSAQPIKIDVSGDYFMRSKEFAAEIRAKDVSLGEFARYYEKTGLSFPEGRLDSLVNLKYKGSVLSVDAEAVTRGLQILKDEISAEVTGKARASGRYDFAGKKLDYTGNADIEDMSIDGVEYIEAIDELKGRLEFTGLGLSSDNMTLTVLGFPFEAKIKVEDLSRAVLEIDASSDIKLASFQEALKDEFGLNIPADLDGDAKLRLEIRYPLGPAGEFRMKGSLYALNDSIKFNNGKDKLENVTGRFRFVPNQVSWDDIGFRYHDARYRSSGALTDFKAPGVRMKLSSEDVSLEAAFAVNGKAFNFSKLTGKYLDSGFSVRGSLDASDPARLPADIEGSLNIDLEDLKKASGKLKEKIERARPEGMVKTEFSLKGDLRDLKTCAVDAKISSDELSLYGLKLATSTMNYSQKDGAGDILFMKSFFYGGSTAATGRIDWAAPDSPYRFDVEIDGIRVERFKADTSFKDKDIAGSVKLRAKLKGFLADAGRLSGEGKISVTDGKLWQLNLFQGLGVLLFTSDFNNIIFKEGRCDFTIADKAIYTDELTLKSELLDLYGPVRIGFDNSVSATLKAEFPEDVFESNARTNIKAAIGKFTYIEVAGTLKEPKYRIRPDVQSMAESFAERLAGE